MSTSSNKSQKQGEDGMGKAGKRHEMVKGTYERLACERVACVYICMCVCVCVNHLERCKTSNLFDFQAPRFDFVFFSFQFARDPGAPPEPAQCHKCHTCPAK